jgi:hypothetical protein
MTREMKIYPFAMDMDLFRKSFISAEALFSGKKQPGREADHSYSRIFG